MSAEGEFYFYTLPEAARALGCGPRTVLNLLTEGVLEGEVHNGRGRFTRTSVDQAARRGIGRGAREIMIVPATVEVVTPEGEK